MPRKRKATDDSRGAVPEVPSDPRPEVQPVVVPDRVPPRATGTRRITRLDAFKFTAPVTLEDLTRARDVLRSDAPDAAIEVYTRNHGVIYVELRWPDQIIQREFQEV